jgi:hypothetical protein
MAGMDVTIHATFLPGRLSGLLSRHARLRGQKRRRVRRDALDHGRPTGQPDTSIVLYPPAATPGITGDERRTVAEMMAKGTYASVNLATTDLDGTFERPQVGEAEVVQEPTYHPYGIRDCSFRDPAGNLIRIQEVRNG